MKNRKTKIIPIIIGLLLIYGVIVALGDSLSDHSKGYEPYSDKVFKLISSSENEVFDKELLKYAEKQNIDLNIEYADTLDIVDRLNEGEKFDAVWVSNSIWLYRLDSNVVSVKNSKSTSITPIVFGIKKSKAEELGFINKEVYMKDLLSAIEAGKLKFSMSNPTKTNSGASAYLGIVSTLAGNPEVLTEKMLNDETLKEEIKAFFSGTDRTSGDEDYLEELFLNGDYDAVMTYESSIININKKLEKEKKEPLYAIYPVDGVSISDSPFAYIDNKIDTKKEEFDKLQSYILSDSGQKLLAKYGKRTWYGGTKKDADQSVFNKEWGIDTTKYISPVKYPSTNVIKKALVMYQTEFRKPIHVVFCLDYSGSIYKSGYKELLESMDYILTDEASNELIQFSSSDQIDVLAFNSDVQSLGHTDNGEKTEELLRNIHEYDTGGSTALYPAAKEAIEILSRDGSDLGKTVILMTDGDGNVGRYSDLKNTYNEVNKDIPIYSIMFGSANEDQLEKMAKLSNGKVFNGKTDLVAAFKEVRGYN